MNSLEWLDAALGEVGEHLQAVPIPFRCRCGRAVVLEGPPPQELVFSCFDAQNIARLIIHMACHYAQLLRDAHAYQRAMDDWQNEGGA